MRCDLAGIHGRPHGTAGLAIVPAVAKAAMAEQRTDLDERVGDRLGRDVREAQARAYEAVSRIDWPDGFYRRDIGWRAIAREEAKR